jgi:hypothetical protein
MQTPMREFDLIYRDKLNIDIKQVQSEIEEKMAQLRDNPVSVSSSPC